MVISTADCCSYELRVGVGVIMHKFVAKSSHIAKIDPAMEFAKFVRHIVCRLAKYYQMIQYQFRNTVTLDKIQPCSFPKKFLDAQSAAYMCSMREASR